VAETGVDPFDLSKLDYWTRLSVEYANQRSYLDDLFRVYPLKPDGIREINTKVWTSIERYFNEKNNEKLLEQVFKLELPPITDSYVACLKRDASSLKRNPQTVARLCGLLHDLELDKLYERSVQAKETNRQIGSMFRKWINKGSLGMVPVSLEKFVSSSDNAILDGSDKELKKFAEERLGYKRDKGLDLVARFNGKYVLGEAKFLTDYGGRQNSQFNDAITTLTSDCYAIMVAILDGVIYIPGNNGIFRSLFQYSNKSILSSLLLREFLYQI